MGGWVEVHPVVENFQSVNQSYETCLQKLNIENLSECRENLCLSCAKKSTHMFPKNDKVYKMETRQPDTYKKSSMQILKESAII